jgi:Arc/MetJ-type ribon-helix-helix transcriptional regulator
VATSVRMDNETEKLLDSLAQEAGTSKSEVIRMAVRLAARERNTSRAQRPHHVLRGIIGSVRGGPKDLSEQTGKRFRDLLLRSKGNRS